MTTLAVKNFSFAYDTGQRNILNNISFSPVAGSFNLLIGPSGSGKSTLLKAMAGLMPKFGGIVTGGQILLDGQDIQPVAPFERAKRVAMLFQNPDRQFAMRTAPEQIAFALENIQLPAEQIQDRVADVMTRLNLTAFAEQDLMTLSGGEKQRVALATILAMDSDIILLDEPFANVDPQARQTLLHDLQVLQQTQGKTIVISDHDLSGYAELVDNLYVLEATTGTLQSASLTCLTNLAPVVPFVGQPNPAGDLGWRQLHVSVGERTLLTGTTFTVPSQQIGLISGANGIGKSTLFKALTKQISATGTITWAEQDTRKIKAKAWAKRVALIFQTATDQFVTMTVAEELALSQRQTAYPDFWTAERVADAVAQLNLTSVMDHIVYQLSGGQQKKLQTLVMLIMGQPVLLLDEPLAGLDQDSVQAVMTLLQTTVHATQQAILMISHQRQGLADFIDYELVFAEQQLRLIGGSAHA
ncbi:ABC transporter ATP-binding protein [Weissella sp. MSCH1]|uniref:ABC transporter ATP-binding protein n=1 Tax=Weissella sp. MSCH1 TaxID=3383343 RepID=UPI003896EEBE